MKKPLVIILLCLINSVSFAQPVKVLFLGNSYTAVNALPNLVYQFSLSKGDTIITGSNTPGGYTFELHTTDSTSLAKIYSEQWDYVVLQEQSQLPSFPPSQVAQEVYPFATMLDSMIHDNNSCSETVFYMTWGRKNGDASNCAGYPPVCTYEGMQARLRESYLAMGMQNNATVSPVGAAFSYVRSLNPSFDLYSPDESHPSIYGSYLAACVFYATIFHKNPEGSIFYSQIGQQDASFLQSAAKAVVIDSIGTWYQYGNIPLANFNTTINNNMVHFNNTSIHANNFSWNFGDGGTATNVNPNHTYAQAGSYLVTLTVTSACKSAVFSDSVYVGTTSLNQPISNCSIFYNYNSESLESNCISKINSVSIFDLRGKLVLDKEIVEQSKSIHLNLDGVAPGLYLLKAEGKDYSKSIKILVN